MGHIETVRSARPATRLETFLSASAEWCAGRTWWPRALLLLYLVYADYRLFRDPESSTMFSGITLAIHELGHVIFGFVGHFIGSLMGSGTQVLVPLIVVLIFAKQPDYFGISVGGFWLSFSLFELARYVGDARSMDLPLVTYGSGDPEHDWNYLLGTVHALPLDHALALLLRLLALAIGASSLTYGIWLLLQMQQNRSSRPPRQFL
ncbi:MAG: hypothetical protein ABI837_03045 [Acidobacteriota bacterium]